MSTSKREYGPRDVVWAVLLHLRTATAIPKSRDKYEVEGKERPLLVMTPPTTRGTQQTLGFTTTRPKAEFVADYLHHGDKDGNRSDILWKFGPSYGFKEECYLDIAESHPIPMLRKKVRKHQKPLDQHLFDHICKEHYYRSLGYQIAAPVARDSAAITKPGRSV